MNLPQYEDIITRFEIKIKKFIYSPWQHLFRIILQNRAFKDVASTQLFVTDNLTQAGLCMVLKIRIFGLLTDKTKKISGWRERSTRIYFPSECSMDSPRNAPS